ncbi:MAG TPA: TlpA disulfide reductase family protein [Pyrinomonadaceae bacterium]|nr:TlpA disulfide reductase family protein [Pyrinomonadaceae bacterium]
MSQTEKRNFWTAGRAAGAAAVFLATALAVSSCTADDTARDAARPSPTPAASAKPSVTITSRPGGQQQPQQQQQAPSDRFSAEVMKTQLRALDGGTFSLGDYSGRAVVLDIWATWCGPCRKEVPHLVEIQKEYKARGVEVLGLTLEDPVRDADKVREFADEFNINYKVGWVPRDVAIEIMRGNGSIPQTFVIAPGGRIVAHYRGYSDSVPGMIRAALDKVQAGQSGDD